MEDMNCKFLTLNRLSYFFPWAVSAILKGIINLICALMLFFIITR